MLPKENRLKRKIDIERVLKNGKGFKENFLLVKTVKNNLENSRFAFIVPQKVSKKATGRNKIRRRLSEVARIRMKDVKKGIDVVIVTLPGFQEKGFWETEKTVMKLFHKAEIMECTIESKK